MWLFLLFLQETNLIFKLTDKRHPNGVGCDLISRLVKNAIKY